MLKRLLTLLTLVVFAVPATFAQGTGTITGTVTDAETGETIPGANVALTDLQVGAATNSEGEYTIQDVPVGTHTLRVTFVGYQPFTTEVTIQENQTLTQRVQLQSGAVGLEEVVVTGYGGQQTTGEVTGSISKINTQELEGVPAQNVEGLLQGRTSGVSVKATSGNPGSGFQIEVRGQTSINAGSRPLYIVDGVQMSFGQTSEETDRSPLNTLDPSDIESIQVLKDAAAAAIYGAQAANGVVLIETKSGAEGPVDVSVNFESGVRFQTRRFDMANRDQWSELQQEAFADYPFFGFREDILPSFGYESDTPVDQLRDFNWQDYIYDPGIHSKLGFTARGGDEDTQFFLSGNYTNTSGAIQAEASGYRQYNLRSNVDQQLFEDLNLSLKLNFSNNRQAGLVQDGFFINSPFYQGTAEEPPISFPYDNDGTYNPNTEQSSVFNPALFLNENTVDVNTTQFVGSLQPTWRITSWLTARGTFGLDFQEAEETEYDTPTFAPSAGGELSRRFNDVTNINFNTTLNASYTFGDNHNVSGILGSEYRREYEDEEETGFQGFNNSFIRVPAGASSTSFFQGFNTEYRILSYFSRANYNYDDRYIATLTGRFDGSSRFGDDNQWGFFPSASVAWRLSEEEFFDFDTVTNLKVRASFGVTGNSLIGGAQDFFDANVETVDNFASEGLFGTAGSYRGQVGFRPNQLPNPSLSWEENRELNLGLDWGLFSGRVSGNVNFYRSTSDQLLLNRPLPASSGFSSIAENVGELRNEGIEISIETVNIQTESFRWSTRGNFSVNQNEIIELTAEADALDPGGVLPIEEGHSIQAWKVPLWAGVNPADGRPMWYDKDGNLTYRPGQADRQFFDGGESDVVGGFGTTLQYKGFSVDAFFDYAFGGKNLPNTQRTWTDPFGENVLEFVVEERWEEPGDVARYPRTVPFGAYDSGFISQFTGVPPTDDADQISTFWLYKSNYIRLKNVSLSYSFPEELAGRFGLNGARIRVTGLNLVQWTPYLGLDPESAGPGEESSYPAEQQVNVGIQLDL